MSQLVNKFKPIIAGTLFSIILLNPIKSFGNEKYKETFNYVANEMGIDSVKYPFPEINFVSRKELQNVFIRETKKSYLSLRQEQGEKEAKRILDFYLEYITALYVSNDKSIYVREDFPPCKEKSKVGHEITHYFQDLKNGKIVGNGIWASNKRIKRETEASHMERKIYRKCLNELQH